MKIAIASDHAGFELKEIIIQYLINNKIKIKNLGTFSKKSVDYPDFALKVCSSVNNKETDLGILICGTGIGMSIVANKIKGIRCALCNDVYSAKMAKFHNNANILSIGSRVLGIGTALMIVDIFIYNKFEGKKHKLRLNKIKNIENK